ncbi:MAG TPA: FAD:protein FMN transferase [Vicinamibacterales bacterium]|nr:FAD:protein FMN transferase [Vicinamibacterales bacterium]
MSQIIKKENVVSRWHRGCDARDEPGVEMTVISPDRCRTDPASRMWSRRAILRGLAARRSTGRGAWIHLARRAMACSFEVTLASEDASDVPAARAALDDLDTIEDQLTIFRHTSAIAHVNRRAAAEPVAITRAVFDLLCECGALYRATAGAFDITSTPLSRCWGFLQREGHLPSSEAIDAARANVGFDAVTLDRDSLTVRFARDGIELNLGAIGKGYALDRAAARMRSSGVRHALLSAGRSSIKALGGPSGAWPIDIISPILGRSLARVSLSDAALGTSGAGEQFIHVQGVRYGHVIDPRSGWPATGILSATVIATDAASADALSTAFFIGGTDLARTYCGTHPGTVALITAEGQQSPIVIGHRPGVRVELV